MRMPKTFTNPFTLSILKPSQYGTKDSIAGHFIIDPLCVFGREPDAAVRDRLAKQMFLIRAVDVDVSRAAIHSRTAVHAGFEPLKPQNASHHIVGLAAASPLGARNHLSLNGAARNKDLTLLGAVAEESRNAVAAWRRLAASLHAAHACRAGRDTPSAQRLAVERQSQGLPRHVNRGDGSPL